MGQLRTANNRRNRALRNAVQQTQAASADLPTSKTPATVKGKPKPKRAAS